MIDSTKAEYAINFDAISSQYSGRRRALLATPEASSQSQVNQTLTRVFKAESKPLEIDYVGDREAFYNFLWN